MTRLFKFRILLFAALITFGTVIFHAPAAPAWTEVTLAWAPNSEPDLAGYRIYARLVDEAYDYDFEAWEGTETTCTLDIGEADTDWCFVARAFDTEGFESADSEEVCTGNTIPAAKSAYAADDPFESAGLESNTAGGCFIDLLSSPLHHRQRPQPSHFP